MTRRGSGHGAQLALLGADGHWRQTKPEHRDPGDRRHHRRRRRQRHAGGLHSPAPSTIDAMIAAVPRHHGARQRQGRADLERRLAGHELRHPAEARQAHQRAGASRPTSTAS